MWYSDHYYLQIKISYNNTKENFSLCNVYIMGFIPNGDNKTKKIASSSSSTGTTYLRNVYDVSIVNESLADGEILSFKDGKWSNVAQTPTTYPFSLFQGLSQKGIANGYAGLDNNSQISTSNIPDIPHSKITNL